MRFGKQNARKRILNSRFTTFGLLIVAAFMLSSVYQRYVIDRQTLKKTAGMEAQLEALYAHKAALSKKVQYLQDNRGVEEEIRRNFDVAKPGEQVIILTGSDTSATPVLPTSTATSVHHPWYRFW